MDSLFLEKDNSCVRPSLGCLEETTWDCEISFGSVESLESVLQGRRTADDHTTRRHSHVGHYCWLGVALRVYWWFINTEGRRKNKKIKKLIWNDNRFRRLYLPFICACMIWIMKVYIHVYNNNYHICKYMQTTAYSYCKIKICFHHWVCNMNVTSQCTSFMHYMWQLICSVSDFHIFYNASSTLYNSV